jgi:hypothetical protein
VKKSAILLLLCAATAAHTSETRPDATTTAMVQVQTGSPARTLDPLIAAGLSQFFELLGKRDVDGAFDTLSKGTRIAESKEDVKTLKSKTEDALRLFGDISGYDIAEMKTVGQHLLGVTCLSIGKSYPLRWRFYYYNNGGGWRLIDIRVDAGWMDMFGEPDTDRPKGREK